MMAGSRIFQACVFSAATAQGMSWQLDTMSLIKFVKLPDLQRSRGSRKEAYGKTSFKKIMSGMECPHGYVVLVSRAARALAIKKESSINPASIVDM